MADILPKTSKIETTEFEEGFSNRVYLIHWDHIPQLVLRVPNIDCTAFYINHSDEINTLKLAASVGLSPNVAWHDDAGGVACDFVSQPSLDWTVEHQDKDVIRLAQALAKAHTLPVSEHKYSIFDVIEHYLKMIKHHGRDDHSICVEYEYLQALFEQLIRPAMLIPPVLCHNDLNPKNVLMDDEKLWLIDWEYSGTGDALFDLAVVAKSHNLDDRQIAQLISSYQSDLPMKKAFEVVADYMKAYSLREMAWLLLKHLLTPTDTLSLEYYYEFKATPNLNPFPLT
jgi:thiamine kinase-like enzyme